jgi:dipeptidyl aminopeptidase/acylaminoacyl peptidase
MSVRFEIFDMKCLITARTSSYAQLGILVSLFTLLLPSLANAWQSQGGRPFNVDDLFELESVGRYYGGPYAFSSDGRKLALTRVRPKRILANHKWDYLWGNAGGDVWVQMNADQEPFNITNGARDGSGWWSPEWSPDGHRLAMLSTHGDNVRLWIWDENTRKLRQISSRAVDLGINEKDNIWERPYLWVDSQHLLYAVLPESQQPEAMTIEVQVATMTASEWPKVQKGEEVTASVLESGVPIALQKRTEPDLLLIDITTGSEKVIAHGRTRSWQLSPNCNAIAFARQISMYEPKPLERLALGSSLLSTVEIVTSQGTPILIDGEPSDIMADSLRWSPDSNEVALFGYKAGHDELPFLYRVNLSTQTTVAQVLKDLDVIPIVGESPEIEWTATGDLIVLASKHLDGSNPNASTRRDWWLVTKDGTQRCLTGGMKIPPYELWPEDGRQTFVGIVDGEIWRVDSTTGKIGNLTSQFAPKVAGIAWPSKGKKGGGTDEYPYKDQTYNRIIFSVQGSDGISFYIVDLRFAEITRIEKPVSEAELVAYAPTTNSGIFYATSHVGLQVWRGDVRTHQRTLLLGANRFLANIAEGQFKLFEYRSLNGEKLKGWLILPFGYERGNCYPVLVWVYAGLIYGEQPPYYMRINSSVSLNLQIPAARGYAVLLPSMPLAPEGTAEDPMLRLTEGVLPAIDKAIEMGVVDPDRLFLMGQSFGGFATYGLITQTHRFRAAVSLAGLSDLISLYGQFDARERYTDNPQENLFMQELMESGQVRMGTPPWKDLGRYIRNSPIFYVDRVQTPLMIVQGDMDYVALQQGEEFFISLYRQGKRAKFVRYWGEGHVLESPANVRDMWNQILSWFAEFQKIERIQERAP